MSSSNGETAAKSGAKPTLAEKLLIRWIVSSNPPGDSSPSFSDRMLNRLAQFNDSDSGLQCSVENLSGKWVMN